MHACGRDNGRKKIIMIQIKLSTFFFFKSKRFRIFINPNLFPQMISAAWGEFIKTMHLQSFSRDKFSIGQCFCLSGKSFLLSSCWFIQDWQWAPVTLLLLKVSVVSASQCCLTDLNKAMLSLQTTLWYRIWLPWEAFQIWNSQEF